MRNLTITVEEEVARWARVAAAHEGVSVSRFVRRLLRLRMGDVDAYERAMRANLARVSVPLRQTTGRYPSREALHDRAGPRR